MKYNNNQLKDLLINTVRNEDRHEHYDRTKELAELYRKWNTGKDQDDLIVSYKTRETEEQKEQRIKITNSRTKYVSKQVQAVFDEVQRADNVIDNIYYKGDENDESNQSKLKEIHERLDKFSDRQSLNDYLHEKIKYLNFYDPNAFIVVDFLKDDEIEKPWPYPVEIYSHQAIKYEYDRKELQYLIALQETTKFVVDNGKVKEEPAELYYLWAADYAIKFQELGEKGEYVEREWDEDNEPVIITIVRESDDEEKEIDFAFWEYETKSKQNPAIQVGYIGDPYTNLDTYVGILDPAEEIFKDLINTKSEYDLHKALHGFMQKFAYANRCTHTEWVNGEGYKCDGGKLRGIDKTCPSCQGKGLKVHTTSQDIVMIKMPDGKDEHIPLSQMVHYVEIPQHILDAQNEELQDLEQRVSKAVFNANPFDKSEIATTATEKRLLKESVYNAFMKYGAVFSQVYKHCVEQTAIHLNNDDDLIVDHQFPKDYHLDTVEELIDQYKKAQSANVPYAISEVIYFNILTKQSQDNPSHIEIIRAKEQFRPFREKTIEERMFILTELPDNSFQKQLYIHFEEVFDLIENGKEYRDKPFYKMRYETQKETVMKALEEVIGMPLDEIPTGIPEARTMFEGEQSNKDD